MFSSTAAIFEDLHALGRRNARNAHAAKPLRWRSASPHLQLTQEFMPRTEFARGDAEAQPTRAQGAQSSHSGTAMCAAKLFELIRSWSAGDKQRRRSIHVFAQTTRPAPLKKTVYARQFVVDMHIWMKQFGAWNSFFVAAPSPASPRRRG